MFDPGGIEIGGAGGHAVGAGFDAADAAAGAQFDAGADGVGPVGDVGAGFGALGAAECAMPEVDAFGAAVIVRGGQRGIGRPPVPAECVERMGEAGAGFAEAEGGHGRGVGGVGGIAGEAGDAHHAVVFGEEGFEGRVVDGPVIGDAIEGFDAEIGRVEAGVVGGVEDGGAADGCE